MTNKTIRDWTIVVAVLAFIGLSTPAADAGLLCAGASTTFDDPRAPQPDDCTRADATALPTYLPPAITLLGAVAVSGVGSLHLVAAAEVSGATPADTTIPAPDDPRVSLGSPGIVGAHAFASFTMNDFVFTGPSGASGVTVRQGNLHFSGDVHAFLTSPSTTFPNLGQAAGVFVRGSIAGTDFSGDYALCGNGGGPAGYCPRTSFGVLFPFGGSGTTTLRTPSVTVLLGTPYPYHLELSAGASIFVDRPLVYTGEAIVDFQQTLSFPTDGPVFDLPEGYSVNSVEANIVDNRWLGPEAVEPTVPEPGTWMLVASGLAAIGFPQWCRHRPRRISI